MRAFSANRVRMTRDGGDPFLDDLEQAGLVLLLLTKLFLEFLNSHNELGVVVNRLLHSE